MLCSILYRRPESHFASPQHECRSRRPVDKISNLLTHHTCDANAIGTQDIHVTCRALNNNTPANPQVRVPLLCTSYSTGAAKTRVVLQVVVKADGLLRCSCCHYATAVAVQRWCHLYCVHQSLITGTIPT